jgi:uncharacterized protein (UPF0335 family)
MNALVVELGLWIGLAAVLGIVAGFCFGLLVPRRSSRLAAAEAAHHADVKAMRALLDQAREETHHKEELLALLRDEVEALRAQQQAAAGHVAVVDELRALTRSLQERLDESNERVERLERERSAVAAHTGEGTRSVSGAVFTTQSAIALDVQKSQPLTVERFESEFTAVAVTPESADETIEPVPGAERSINDLPGIPSAVKERLALIGASTNLSFLHKAGRRSGRRALVASTRLDEAMLLSWLRLADLMRVGMRTEDLRALWQTGIRGLEELGEADPVKLSARVQARSEGLGGDTIDEATVRRWIERARTLSPLVEA